MGLFKYPYTDLNELNLDWVIERIKEFTEYVATITQAQQISYDNTGTVLSADNVQAAITELQMMLTTGAVTSFKGRTGAVVPTTGDYTAQQVDYDKTGTTLAATNVQGAITELAARPLGGVQSFNGRLGAVIPTSSDYNAGMIAYNNAGSGMTATTAQGAIDELDYRLDNFTVAAGQVTYDNTLSGLTATDAQAAIDEISNDVLSSGVASFKGRTGPVNPAAGDYTAATTDTPEASKTLGTVEGATASAAYAVGDWFIDSDGYTGIAKTPIALGETLTHGTNYERHPLGWKTNGIMTVYDHTPNGSETYADIIDLIASAIQTYNIRPYSDSSIRIGNRYMRFNDYSSGPTFTLSAIVSNDASGYTERFMTRSGGTSTCYEYTHTSTGVTVTDLTNTTAPASQRVRIYVK